MQASIEKGLTLALADTSLTKLTIVFEGKDLKHAETITKAVGKPRPTLKLSSSAPSKGPFVAVGIDLDAPFPSMAIMSPILHYMQSGLEPSASGVLEHKNAVEIDWLPPTPPPFSGPHRYVIMLYEQPSNFEELKSKTAFKDNVSVWTRTRFSLDDFVKATELKVLVAAEWFCV